MFCTKLRGCLCLNPRPFSEVEIDRTCMFEIRLRTAPEIQMCPVVSTQSKQRAAQCEGRIVGAASCSCWKVHCRAVKREEEDRSAPTMYYSTLHPTASSTPLPTKLHAGLNCVDSPLPLAPLIVWAKHPFLYLKRNRSPADKTVHCVNLIQARNHLKFEACLYKSLPCYWDLDGVIWWFSSCKC